MLLIVIFLLYNMEFDDNIWDVLSSLQGKNKPNECEVDHIKSLCYHCHSNNIHLHDGNYICCNCHTVAERHIDTSAEWRFYGQDDNKNSDPTRCGLPTSDLLPDSSLGSIIGYSYNEAYIMKILRKYHMWNCMTYRERSLYYIFDSLTINAVNHGISKSIIDEAKMLYKQLSEQKISRGDNRNGLIASSIYIACKNNNVPRSAKEIAKIFNLKTTTMTKGCKKFQETMGMNMNSTSADDFISRFCSKMNMDFKMKDICREVIRKADEISIVCENTPPSIAAGCIFLCSSLCNWNISKKELSEICEVSQVTITKCYKKLDMYRTFLLPDSVLKDFNIQTSKEYNNMYLKNHNQC